MTQNHTEKICAEEYTVKRGDSFYLIAHKLGVTLRDLLAANRDIHPARLMVGDVLCIPPGRGRYASRRDGFGRQHRLYRRYDQFRQYRLYRRHDWFRQYRLHRRRDWFRQYRLYGRHDRFRQHRLHRRRNRFGQHRFYRRNDRFRQYRLYGRSGRRNPRAFLPR